MSDARPRIVVMGVAGSGKTTIGRMIASRMEVAFVDGDDLHTDASIRKMASGVPLTDCDRAPWLDRVGTTLGHAATGCVMACSALRRAYRDRIRLLCPSAFFVCLVGDASLLAGRLGGRRDHFMPMELLGSQLATLELLDPEEKGVTLDIALDASALADAAVCAVRAAGTDARRTQ